MFGKFKTVLMLLSILSFSAQASTLNGLKEAFNDLNFSLTVVWDQQNKEFKENKLTEFSSKLKELQTQGLTNSQLIEFAKSQALNKQMAQEIEVAFNIISLNRMSPLDASEYMKETMERSYYQGASWNDDGYPIVFAIGAFTIFAMIAAGALLNDTY